MRKLILVSHISLDGFVAGAKGELDGFPAGDENLEFVCRLTDNADACLFGRVSYHVLNDFWPNAKDLPDATKSQKEYSHWYNGANKIVLSKTMSAGHLNNTTIIRENILDKMVEIKNKAGKDILIFGSPGAAQTLQNLGLIDNYWIFVNPVVFGQGIPLFAGQTNKVKLRLLSTRQFSNGEMALHYDVNRQ
jgi:dihydrofolate reductase